MKNISYENRVALFLTICIVAVIATSVAFILRQRSVIANSSFEVQTPSINLDEWQEVMDALRAQGRISPEQEQEQEPDIETQTEQPLESASDITPQE